MECVRTRSTRSLGSPLLSSHREDALFRNVQWHVSGRDPLSQEMKEIFDLLDADGSGSIDPKAHVVNTTQSFQDAFNPSGLLILSFFGLQVGSSRSWLHVGPPEA